jgi:hypothetical protein
MRYLLRVFLATYAAALEVVVMAAAPRDFTRTQEPPSFKIDNDVFFGRKKLNGGAAMKFATLADDIDEKADIDPEQIALMLKRLFRLTLRTSSYKRMSERIDATLGAQSQAMLDDLDPDKMPDDDEADSVMDDDLLDLEQVNEIGEWLLGEYGLRPTEPAGSSSTGQESQVDGTN